ncbi:putative TRAP-type C4-dicarboxylate transport system, small permease component [Vibrio nigripulchritudo SO65]|nr:putative TRAP-type C4-dicarboxylate transport system, small permease component [Vibrio nigripulchritudo AM115]CCN40917.1 putative TRAP-type C4-dicarboxylate transport system, small permease component [Vibrio nigripulchritudo FTn2]CCN66211.1 putative TRAP-type C4-dicarboxylate transport system, small permease component [Vibrio nigripulchritudo POn4]CCN78402.1 putative TRAP-type C4-dicarboxylate transport system, small permease component [Vibrio nigripulchritudo SO65]
MVFDKKAIAVNHTRTSLPAQTSNRIDKFVKHLSYGIAWVYVLLVIVILVQVVMRKGFSHGLIALEELQWHLYALGVLFGLAYAETTNSHVRVDILYQHFSPRAKAWIEILGISLFLFPFVFVVFIHSLDFVYESWRVSERSNAPSGLPFHWLIKSAIPLAVALLALAGLSKILRSFAQLQSGGAHGN